MKIAEWWANECGGVFCSNCGLFFDDYYESAPKICERCHCTMIDNTEAMVWRNGRLSLEGIKYADESEYPEWLSKLRKEKNKEMFKQDALNGYVEKMECSVEDFKRLGYTDEEAKEIFKHIDIYH